MNNQILKDHLEKLHPFKIIIEVGNITEASKQIGLTQSTLSHTIKTLEAALDKKLLIRSKNGVKPTKEGALLYKFACSITSQTNGVESQINNMDTELAGNIRIGTHETLAAHIWPSILENVINKNDSISYSINTGRITPIINDILSMNLDLSLTVEPLENKKLNIENIYSGNLKFFTHYNDKKINISLKDLNTKNIFTDVNAHIREGLGITQYLGMNSIITGNIFHLSSFEAATNFCKKGLGYCVLPDRNAQFAVDNKLIKEIKIKGIDKRSFGRYTICATYRKDQDNALVNFFIDELKLFFRDK